MQSMAAKTQHENQADAEQLAKLMSSFDRFPLPTVAVIKGSAFGGALGLIACADIALANNDAKFCLSEVKLGLIPATISPYVCRAIGARQARRYMLSAERFDAATALSIGLIHRVSQDAQTLATSVDELINALLANGPLALKQTKALCLRCDEQPIDEPLIQHTSKLIADVRVSEEAQQGLSAFFEKRTPPWAPRKTKQEEENS
jgi:methylglutaconyl-CoA hydratase